MGNTSTVADLREALAPGTDPVRAYAAWVAAGPALLSEALGTTGLPRDDEADAGRLPEPAMPEPVKAAFIVDLTQKAANFTGYAQILATDAAGRAPVMRLGAGQLNGLSLIGGELGRFARGETRLPSEANTPTSGKPLFRTINEYLCSRLRISSSEARHRVDGARMLLPRPRPDGPALPPMFPRLGNTAAQGTADPKAVVDAARKVSTVEPTLALQPDAAGKLRDFEAAADAALRTLPPQSAKKVMDELESRIGQTPELNDAELRARQGIFFRGKIRGLFHYDLFCTGTQSEHLRNVFDLVDNPNLRRNTTRTPFTGRPTASAIDAPNAADTTDFPNPQMLPGFDTGDTASTPAQHGTPEKIGPPATGAPAAGTPAPDWAVAPGTSAEDWPVSEFEDSTGPSNDGFGSADIIQERTLEQRHLDALTDACKALGTGSTVDPVLRGRAQVVVHTSYETLFGLLEASGRTGHGDRVPPATIRQLACMADIIPFVMGGTGEILDYGRSRRLFSDAQLGAMAARDRGCVWPGCTMPARRSEGHHLNPWSEGGGTAVREGALFCDHHHHLIHTGAGRLLFHAGIPYVVPTLAEDPLRRPTRNLFWHPELADHPFAPSQAPPGPVTGSPPESTGGQLDPA